MEACQSKKAATACPAGRLGDGLRAHGGRGGRGTGWRGDDARWGTGRGRDDARRGLAGGVRGHPLGHRGARGRGRGPGGGDLGAGREASEVGQAADAAALDDVALRSTAREAMTAARRHGAIVSYDLNYRPSLWKSIGGLERAREVNREIARYVDVFGHKGRIDQEVVV